MKIPNQLSTADLRELARKAAIELKWARAAEYMHQAIKNYPPSNSSLRALDIKKMTTLMQSWEKMAQQDINANVSQIQSELELIAKGIRPKSLIKKANSKVVRKNLRMTQHKVKANEASKSARAAFEKALSAPTAKGATMHMQRAAKHLDLKHYYQKLGNEI